MSTNIVLTNNNYNDYLGSDFNAKVESTVFESHTGDTTVHHTTTELDGLYVNIDGDTMTGDLTLNTANLDLDNTTFANKKGIIMKDGVPFIHNFNYGNNGTVTTIGKNIFIGELDGNFTMGSDATLTYHSSYNTVIGNECFTANTTGYQNVMIGWGCLQDNTTGFRNACMGTNVMKTNTTGNYNVGVGYGASRSNTEGLNNTAIGSQALYTNTTGDGNVAIGYDALRIVVGDSNIGVGETAGRFYGIGTNPFTTGSYNIFLGADTNASADGVTYETVIGAGAIGAGSNTTTIGNTSQTKCKINGNIEIDNTTFANQKGVIMKDGVPFIHNFNYGNNGTVTTEGKNIFIGEKAGNLTMGSTATATNQSSYNVGIGYSVLSGTTKSYFNTAIGTYALQNNLEGFQNTAIGYQALKNNTTNNNISIGANSSLLNTSGTGNVTIGVNAAIDNTTGNYNTVVGFLTLENNDGGVGNTAIGKYAGRYFAASDPLTTPDYCIFLGTETLASADNVQYENVIGAKAIGAGSNTTTIGNISQTLCKINGAVQVGQSSATATAALVGAIRYRTSGNNSYCEMVMQTAASTYAWVVIKQNTW